MSTNVTSFSGIYSGHPRNAQTKDLFVFLPDMFKSFQTRTCDL